MSRSEIRNFAYFEAKNSDVNVRTSVRLETLITIDLEKRIFENCYHSARRDVDNVMSDKEDGETIYFIDYYSEHEYSVVKIEEIPLEDCSIKSEEVQSAAICGAKSLRINSESKNSVLAQFLNVEALLLL